MSATAERVVTSRSVRFGRACAWNPPEARSRVEGWCFKTRRQIPVPGSCRFPNASPTNSFVILLSLSLAIPRRCCSPTAGPVTDATRPCVPGRRDDLSTRRARPRRRTRCRDRSDHLRPSARFVTARRSASGSDESRPVPRRATSVLVLGASGCSSDGSAVGSVGAQAGARFVQHPCNWQWKQGPKCVSEGQDEVI